MINPVDHGLPFGDQPCQYQASGRPEVRGHDLRTTKRFHPTYQCRVTPQFYVGTHSLKLLYMHKAILEHGLSDRRRPARNCVQQDELGLHVGGKTWKGLGAKVSGLQTAFFYVQLDSILFDAHPSTHFSEFAKNRFQ
jgi:hypothetical protein|tara:strand:- start:50 stop:460 length:411 start_codon:yes stop_codon:yes gene_type:complete